MVLLALAGFLSGCSGTSASSTTTTSVKQAPGVVSACKLVQSYSENPNPNQLPSVATAAEDAGNSRLHEEGTNLAALIPTKSSSNIDIAFLRLANTCVKLGLVQSPTVTTPPVTSS
jgi:hypothetical protein